MAIHSRTEDMLKESLVDMLNGAEVCIQFKKEKGGCLGYPAAVLLLSIVDTIGSYYEGNKDFKIKIDGKLKTIDGDAFKHFFILNSEYYDFQLSEKFIKKIYDNYRSLLVHNGVIAPGHLITIDDPLRRAMSEDAISNSATGKNYPSIHLKPFYRSTEFAVSKFIKKVDTVFPKSKQASIINKRK